MAGGQSGFPPAAWIVLAAMGGGLGPALGLTALSSGGQRTPGADAKTPNDAPAKPQGTAAVCCSPPPPDAPKCKPRALCLAGAYFHPHANLTTSGVTAGLDGREIRTLIATVPDPHESSFAEDFDHDLDAIRRAIERTGYILDRHWLPWPRDGQVKSEAAKSEVDEPGVLLFRGAERADKVLVLLLVGEIPDRGVHPAAMREALAVARSIAERSSAARVRDLIPLLGPHFSGSAVSLRRTIDAWSSPLCHDACDDRVKVEIISGSATNPSIKDTLGPPFATFHATVNPADWLVAKLREFHRQLGVKAPQVAELTESSTTFGQGHLSQQGGSAEVGWPGLELPFPLHIFAIRDRHKPVAATPEGNLRRLGTQQSAATGGHGVLAAWSQSSADTKELQLAELLATIDRQEISNVGIFATSTDDKLFLAQQIRAYCPNVRVYTYESSLKLAGPMYARDLDGALVASSYPLFTWTQLWRGRGANKETRQLLQFPNEASQGVYNATLALLSKADDSIKINDWLVDYGRPFRPAGAVQDGPPVWISAVIGGSLWPLAVFDGSPSAVVFRSPRVSGHGAGSHDVDHLPRATTVGSLGVYLLLVLCALNLLPFIPGKLRNLTAVPGVLVYKVSFERKSDGNAAERWTWSTVAAGLLVLLGVTSGLALLYALPTLSVLYGDNPLPVLDALAARERPFVLTVAALAAAIAGLVAAAAYAAGRAAAAVGDAQSRALGRRTWQRLTVLACVLAFAAATSRVLDIAQDPSERALLFFVRLMHPSGGLTPTLPLITLSAALYLACLFHLMYLRVLPACSLDGVFAPRDSDTKEGVARFLRPGPRFPAGWLAVVLAYAIGIGGALCRLSSIDGVAFDVVANLAFAVVFLLAVVAALWALALWRSLCPLLQELAAHPLAATLDRLPSSVSRAFGYALLSRLSKDLVARLLRAQARLLANLRPPASPPTPLDEAIAAASEEPGPESRKLAELGGALLKILPQRPSEREQVAPQSTPATAEWNRVAEDFVALRLAAAVGKMFLVLRCVLSIVACSSLAAIVAVGSYPFAPRGVLTLASVAVVGFVAALTLLVVVQADRDEALSRMSKSTPGKVTWSWGFIVRLVTLVGLPVAGLLTTQLSLGGASVSVIGGALQALLKFGE